MRDNLVEVILRLKDMTASGVSAFMRRWNTMTAAIKGAAKAVGIVVGAFVAATAALTKLSQQGAKAIGIKTAFARTTDDETAALNRLRQASGGTITDLDLMARHNQALALGTARSTDEFARMLRVSDALGDSLGIDGVDAMNRFADVMASGSQRAARALGIEIEAGMTRNQILERAEEVANRIKGEMGEGVEAGERFWTSIKNGKDQISEMVASMPLVSAFFDAMAKGVDLVVAGFEKLAKLFRLLPEDWNAGAGDGTGAPSGPLQWLSNYVAENPVTRGMMHRDMSGFGVSPEALARFQEYEAKRMRRMELGPALDPMTTAARFQERQAMVLPGIDVRVSNAKDAALGLEDATEIAVDSMGRMADAAVSESARMSQAIIGSLQQVIANIKMKDGLFGSTLFGGVLGVGLGLLGAAFGRRKDPVLVQVADYGQKALSQMKQVSGPERIVNVLKLPDGTITSIEEVEREQLRRQRADEIVRYGARGHALRG